MLGWKHAVMKKRGRAPLNQRGVSRRGPRGSAHESEHRNTTHRQPGSLLYAVDATPRARLQTNLGGTVVTTGEKGENLDGGLLGEVLVVAAPLELGALRRLERQDVRLLVRHALPRGLEVAAQFREAGRF